MMNARGTFATDKKITIQTKLSTVIYKTAIQRRVFGNKKTHMLTLPQILECHFEKQIKVHKKQTKKHLKVT